MTAVSWVRGYGTRDLYTVDITNPGLCLKGLVSNYGQGGGGGYKTGGGHVKFYPYE